MYTSIQAGARGLLGEATMIAASCGLEFAVCGGWSPFLRNSKSIRHPGTTDVDLLFADGATPEALREVVKTFLRSGYIMSAKHEFQVLRVLPIKSQEFVFNVDFLHPNEPQGSSELFVDHLELDVPQNDFVRSLVKAKSIGMPHAGFVFNGYVELEPVECTLPDGTAAKLEIPLIDEVGLLVTKSKSSENEKRPRDLFDIYLAITSPKDRERFRSNLERLKSEDLAAFSSIGNLNHSLKTWVERSSRPKFFADAQIDFGAAAEEIRTFLGDL